MFYYSLKREQKLTDLCNGSQISNMVLKQQDIIGIKNIGQERYLIYQEPTKRLDKYDWLKDNLRSDGDLKFSFYPNIWDKIKKLFPKFDMCKNSFFYNLKSKNI